MHNRPAATWDEFVLAWELLRDPMLCALVAGSVLGFLSVYIFLRRMVFVSATVTQSAGLGIAVAFYADIHLAAHIEPIAAAAFFAIGTTLLLNIDTKKFHFTREGLLGLLFAFAGGCTVLIGSHITQEAHDIQSILFGTAVLVAPLDLYLITACGSVLIALHLWWFRGLNFASFDAVAARVQGLPVRALQSFVLLSIGLMVGTSARALGALPVFALSTLPAMAALLMGGGLRTTFALATVLGGIMGFGGYMLAFFTDHPVGATQTVTATALVMVALAVAIGRHAFLQLGKRGR